MSSSQLPINPPITYSAVVRRGPFAGRLTVHNNQQLGNSPGNFGNLFGFYAAFEPSISLKFRYMCHLSDIGDVWFDEGAFGDDTKLVEGISIQLYGAESENYSVAYTCYVDFQGWRDGRDGEFLGSRGRQGRIEAIYLNVTRRGAGALADTLVLPNHRPA